VILCGVMSGTSLDGIDVAVVEARGALLRTLAFQTIPYPPRVREALLSVSNGMTHTAVIARLHFLLGELYAEAIRRTCYRRVPLERLEWIGLHGQTIFHEGAPVEYLGRRVASTYQIGDPAVVAERTGVAVVSNFRERDVAAGGQGAPLVPFVDALLFRHRRRPRVALNIGGIANITVLPPMTSAQPVVAFDTGPGNMVIDALVRKLTGGKQTYDRGGRIARGAQVHQKMLDGMLRDPYFRLPPPKTAGREQFGQEFASGLMATGVPLEDLIATATEFTVRSIALAIAQHAPPESEVIVSGGGVHNRWMIERLRQLLPAAALTSSARFGIHPDAKEAIAFALLAREFARGRAANLPSATGARRGVILGRLTPA
jgi:anhydro-N-acetylmuramic acid kinase